MLPQAVSDYDARQRRLILAAIAQVRREWAAMGDDLDASWAAVGPRVAVLTSAAQIGAASNGAAYVPATLDELDQSVDPVAEVNPRALTGAQSLDGLTYGSLEDLLYGAVIHARTTRADSLAERLLVGRAHLDRLVHTQVSDAGKQSASVAMTVREGVGYVRVVTPPCCRRCAVLAGKYSAPTAFPRHPRCDCTAMPVRDRESVPGQEVDPSQITDLSAAERKALAEGADLSQVINSSRGRSKDGMTTTEGATRRGLAGQRLGAKRGKRAQRLTPEGIYRVSATREEAIKRLRDNGYIR